MRALSSSLAEANLWLLFRAMQMKEQEGREGGRKEEGMDKGKLFTHVGFSGALWQRHTH